MHQHDESSSTDVVNAPGEADEEDGCHMVNYLLIEVFAFDISSHTEEQRAVETQLNHIVPILRWEESQHRETLPHRLQVIQPRFIDEGGQASNESKKVKGKSPTGLSELFEQTRSVLVPSSPEPSVHLSC